MRLQRRVMRLTGAVLLGYCIVVVAVAYFVLLPSFANLEMADLDRNWSRANDYLDHETAALHERSFDWAQWDDADNFVKHPNQEFLDSNCPDDVLAQMRLDAFVITNRDGKPIFARAIKRTAVFPAADLPALYRTLQLRAPSKGKKLKSLGRYGIVVVGDHLMQVSIRPITNTAETSEPSGWMVWGRWLNSSIFDNISRTTRLDARLIPIATGSTDEPITRVHEVTSHISMSRPIEDLHGRLVSRVEVTVPRMLMQHGDSTVSLMILSNLLAGAVGAILFALILRKWVAEPLAQISSQVEAVDIVNGRGTVQVRTNDEFADLADQMNTMLQRIEFNTEEIHAQGLSLEESNKGLLRANDVLQSALDGIAVLTVDGKFISANERCRELFGFRDLEGRRLLEIATAECDCDCGDLRDVNFRKEVAFACFYDGEERKVEAILLPEFGSDGAVATIHAFFQDVTERTRLASKLEFQAYHDNLTGLPNRAHFERKLNELASRGGPPVGVLFIDVDDFKYVNDSYGHELGDLFLQEMANRLYGAIGEHDLAARMGGDEFTVLLNDPGDDKGVALLCEALVKELSEPIRIEGKEIHPSCSVGYASSALHSPKEVMRNADTALFAAKQAGKGRFALFDSTMHDRVLERVQIDEGLRSAIANKEFRLAYQPLVDIETNRIIGAEALLRWNNPRLGEVSPMRFIPIAEETGLILPIGEWVMAEACEQAAKWTSQTGFPLTINVNVSQKQLRAPSLLPFIERTLKETGLHPNHLNVEITETLAMTELEHTTAMLHELRRTGVQVSIDDFGTGYSSLSYLQRLPVNCVKIDRSFVKMLGQSESPRAIIVAIIALCREMNFKIAGEGVETFEQLMWLREMGCNLAQGYFFAKPLPAEEFERLLYKDQPFELLEAA